MKTATSRQVDVLRAIDEHVRVFGFPPSQREIALAIGIRENCLQAVEDHIRAMAKKGLVIHHQRTPRGLKITDAGHEAMRAAA